MLNILNFQISYVDIVFSAVILASALIGYFRGILITIIRFIRNITGFILCFYLSSNLSDIVYQGYIKDMLYNKILSGIESSQSTNVFIENINNIVTSLPQFLTSGADLSVLTPDSKNLADVIMINIAEPVAIVAIKVLIFLLSFVIFFGATGFIIALCRKISKKKDDKRGHKTVLKKTDMFFGGLFGILKAIVLLFALTAVAMYFANLYTDNNSFVTAVQGSRIIYLLNEINPFNAITEGLI